MKKLWLVSLIILAIAALPALAADDGQTQPKTNTALNNSHTVPTDLIPSTNGAGNVKGILCVLTESGSGSYTSPLIKFYVNGGSAQSVTLDADYAAPHVISGGNFRFTGWVPFNVRFTSSIQVTIQKPSSGGSTIQCQASWALD
jgi:hypothetical protein